MKQPEPDMQEFEALSSHKAILFHGFSREEINALIDALKQSPAFSADVMMAASTPNSISRTLKELIRDWAEDHAYFRKKRTEQEKS